MRTLTSLALVAFGALASRADAQLHWTRRDPSPEPSGRVQACMAYDSVRQQTVLFGGIQPTGTPMFFHDTWEWDGLAWARAVSPIYPSARTAAAMAFNSARGQTVLFGGYLENGTLSNETWEWNGTAWQSIATPIAPSARYGHALAYDAARGRVLLFGGDDGRILSDTWEWDGTTWSLHTPLTSPPPRRLHALAWDAARGHVLLFGGDNAAWPPYLSDTWEWDGANWVQRTVSPSPSARSSHVMAFDAAAGLVILYGGENGCAQTDACFEPDTWAWDGTGWMQLPTAPWTRSLHQPSMAYDAARNETVLVQIEDEAQGVVDTWMLTARPEIRDVSPPSGSESGGDLVSIRGAGLWGFALSAVSIGGAAATIVEAAPDRLVVQTPPGSGAADIVVMNYAGSATRPAAFAYVAPWIAARFGNVGQRRGRREDVVRLDFAQLDATRETSTSVGRPLRLFALAPSSLPSARFALWCWLGAPVASTATPLPRGAGTFVFPPPFAPVGPRPIRTFNNIGHYRRLGRPDAPSRPAPSYVFSRATGARAPVTVTLQGVIEDADSVGVDHVSATNAIILHVVP